MHDNDQHISREQQEWERLADDILGQLRSVMHLVPAGNSGLKFVFASQLQITTCEQSLRIHLDGFKDVRRKDMSRHRLTANAGSKRTS